MLQVTSLNSSDVEASFTLREKLDLFGMIPDNRMIAPPSSGNAVTKTDELLLPAASNSLEAHSHAYNSTFASHFRAPHCRSSIEESPRRFQWYCSVQRRVYTALVVHVDISQ